MEWNKERNIKNIAVIVGVAAVLVGLIIYFTFDILNIRWPSKEKNIAAPPIEIYEPIRVQTPVPENKNLVKDIVCANMVDADKTAFYSKFLDYTFYFDNQQCLDKFNEDPMKYLPGKLKIKIKMKNEPKEIIVREPREVVRTQPRQKMEVEDLETPANVGDYPPGTVEVSPDDQ